MPTRAEFKKNNYVQNVEKSHLNPHPTAPKCRREVRVFYMTIPGSCEVKRGSGHLRSGSLDPLDAIRCEASRLKQGSYNDGHYNPSVAETVTQENNH